MLRRNERTRQSMIAITHRRDKSFFVPLKALCFLFSTKATAATSRKSKNPATIADVKSVNPPLRLYLGSTNPYRLSGRNLMAIGMKNPQRQICEVSRVSETHTAQRIFKACRHISVEEQRFTAGTSPEEVRKR